jgi:nucleoid DNA-binding protein
MDRIVIGIDPDIKKSGAAVYINGGLKDLYNLSLHDFFWFFKAFENLDPLIVIEDGNLISSIYQRYNAKSKGNKSIQNKIIENIGKNKQRATDLIEIANYFNFRVVTKKPRKGNWSDKKEMFEKVTGWKGRSNPETRSAAFFGYSSSQKEY